MALLQVESNNEFEKENDESFPDIPLVSTIELNFQVLRIFGYWPPDREEGAPKTLKHRIYSIYAAAMLIFGYGSYTLCEFIEMVAVWGDIQEMIEVSFLFLTHCAQLFKTYAWIKNRRLLKDIRRRLNGDIFKPRNRKQYEMMVSNMRWYDYYYKVFLTMGVATCLLWAIFPQLYRDQKILPLRSWSPFNRTTTPGYEITYAYQCIFVFVNAMVNITYDSNSAAFMALICVQLDYLNDNFVNIYEYSLQAIAKRGSKIQNNIDSAKTFIGDGVFNIRDLKITAEQQKEMDSSLIKYIHHHREILRVVNTISEIFSLSVLMQFMASGITVCSTLFKLTLVPLLSLQFVSYILYQGCMLFELFCYCWFGNEILLKSGKLSESAFLSRWIGCNPEYMKKILFVMVRTREPMKMYAGGFFTLSLESFMAVLKTSWSYFAVLQNVKNRS